MLWGCLYCILGSITASSVSIGIASCKVARESTYSTGSCPWRRRRGCCRKGEDRKVKSAAGMPREEEEYEMAPDEKKVLFAQIIREGRTLP